MTEAKETTEVTDSIEVTEAIEVMDSTEVVEVEIEEKDSVENLETEMVDLEINRIPEGKFNLSTHIFLKSYFPFVS